MSFSSLQMTSAHVVMVNGLPQCEGWLEKYSVGGGLFSTHDWQKRYVIVTREGIGYMHHQPEQSLSPSSAHCFIPFEEPHRKKDGTKQRPVYLLRHVAPFMHPEISSKVRGVLSTPSSGSEKSDDVYYFAISFTRGRRRLFLLFRCRTLQDHVVWTSVLSAYIPVGSLSTIVPVPHPLEAHHYTTNNGEFLGPRRKSFKLKGYHPIEKVYGFLYRKDPDPCPPRELKQINKRVLEWDEGEKTRWLDVYKDDTSSPEKTLSLSESNEEEWSKLLYITSELDAACEVDSVDSACSDVAAEEPVKSEE
ncbi:uncharacterized protein TM35_000053830 [Trypanosoma theileri]|uniref:PH domain-containing protein n=1 Tax=Trypanosoma theileri TaxID=67003 RepID=A0A1X0P4C2_9TRYP|nr:uncharacterized protein TM35_000053830 [Trypanosoma theileri]ORC91787.1 hypothetical protein TM35_000053830 [Trypanosoma theileri]